jgi:type IV pilus assembly protein PilX
MALIMLVVLSFAGLIAARNSASFEQYSNNMRTTQVAKQAAEVAIRYCESVAIDFVDNGGAYYVADSAKINTTEIAAPDSSSADWQTQANWKSGGAKLIEVAPTYDSSVQANAKLTNKPACMIQALATSRFVITARGLSNDAKIDGTSGALTNGSEVWLQSILSPGVPIKSAGGGNT